MATENKTMGGTRRLYTHSVVSYASKEEIEPLLTSAKHWAYIKHDRDEGKGPHYHILVTFQTAKSFSWVRKQVVSTQNTFTEDIKGTIADVLTYFTHEFEKDKAQYDVSEIVYDDKDYWKRYGEDDEKERNSTDEFMDDLLAPKFSAEKMARKYGRDFIKNYRSYREFREVVFEERRAELYNDACMANIPKDIDPATGEVQTINCTLTIAQYRMLEELKFTDFYKGEKQ